MESVNGATVALWVDDYDKAIRFYCEQTQMFSLVANATIGPDIRNVVLKFNNLNVPFCIVVYRASTTATSALVGKQGGDYDYLVLPVDDCMSTFERLRGVGVLFSSEPFQLPYGCQATMIDPFGNKVCLSERY